MSYILDALRRAEADRQRGQVPNLGVAQMASAANEVSSPPRVKWAVIVALVALAIGAAGLLGWWRGAAKAPLPPQEQVTTGQAGPAPAAAAVATAVAPATAPAAAGEPPLPQVVSAPAAALPVPASPVPVARTVQPSTPAPAVATAPAPEPAPSLGASVERPPVARPTKLAELTPDQRRELPPLVINGSVWSDSAASRFVILNGQVLREGDTVVPGLVVEKLLPKAAHLRWRGLWLELPY